MIVQFDDVQWGKVLAEAWIDPDFKQRLEAHPAQVLREFSLREFGIEIDCTLDSLTLPDAPAWMCGEHLSGGGNASGTACATATAGGNASGTACATATAGGS